MSFLLSLTLILTSICLIFVDQAKAQVSCERLFSGQRHASIIPNYYKRYDPSNADQQLRILVYQKELEKIRAANPRKTHLTYFEDYIEDTITRLIKKKRELNNAVIDEAVRALSVEAYSKLAQKQVTYFWILEFSSKVSGIMDNSDKHGFRNLDRMKEMFPEDLMIPTFAELEFRHFIEMENKKFTFIGMIESPKHVDGIPVPFSAEQFADHDFTHYMISKRTEKILSRKSANYAGWIALHNKIAIKIKKLPAREKYYTEFIYFYVLHENFGIREILTDGFKKRQLVSYANKLFRLNHLKDYYMYQQNIQYVQNMDLFKRANRENDFKEAFPNKNPQEVLLVGLESFIQILREIDSGR